MPPDPVTALARKWCDYLWGTGEEHEPGKGCRTCDSINGAVREALEKAEKIPRDRGCTKVACGPTGHPYAGCPQNIADAIAALRGGTG